LLTAPLPVILAELVIGVTDARSVIKMLVVGHCLCVEPAAAEAFAVMGLEIATASRPGFG
jgi:hypothetical protein